MILERTELKCKTGRVPELVEMVKAQFEQGFASGQFEVIKRSRILTDLSGPFDTVVIESEVESIDAYFALLKAVFASPQFQESQATIDGDSLVESGKRTFYTIEATFE